MKLNMLVKYIRNFKVQPSEIRILYKLLIFLVVLFAFQVSTIYGQGSWVNSLNCYPDISCWDQELDITAHVNFQVVFTNIFVETQYRGWASTTASCANGSPVQTNVMVSDQFFFFVDYDHWADELNGFNRILMTLAPGSLNEFGVYTPASTLYFPELCSPPPGGGDCLRDINQCQSPVLIDILGNGFDLTNAGNGVLFDINGDGSQEQLAWTSANSDDAWLALDRNGDSIINNGRELFGNNTSQPITQQGEYKSGFRALAVFDRPQRGGNNDGRIDERDAVYADLKLWQDTNHNGISEANELHGISELGLRILDLDYRESRRQDEHGNWFRFRAKVKDARGAQIGRWAWDVFLKVDQ